MASKAELFGAVKLNSRAFDAGLRSMRRTARRWGRDISEVGRIARRGFTYASVAATATAAAIWKLTSDTARAGDEFDKMSLRTGLSAQLLSEYAHAAELAGTDSATLQTAMKGLANFSLAAADGLSTQKRTLDRLGMSADALAKMDPAQAFESMIDRLREIKSPLEQAALAQQIFGRSGQMLLPVIRNGSEALRKAREDAKELGITFDKEAAAKAALFTDQVTRLKGAMAGVRNRLVLAFIGEFSGGIDKAIQKIVELRKDGTIGEWAATAAYSINNLSAIAQTEFARMARFGPAAFDRLRIKNELFWMGIPTVAKTSGHNLEAVWAKFLGTTVAGMLRLVASMKVSWGVIETSGKVVWLALKGAALLSFVAIENAAQKSINAIIAGLNKIPGVTIEPINIESMDAAKKELTATVEEMKKEAANLVPGAAKWQTIIDRYEKAAQIAERSTSAAAEESNKKAAAELNKRLDRYEKLKAKYEDLEKLTEAILGFESDTLKIEERRAKIEAEIAKWQTAARDAENRKTTAAEETLGALAEQSEELEKASNIGRQLRGIFGVPIQMMLEGRRKLTEPRTAMAERERTDAGRGGVNKIEQEQLKVQQAIAASMKSLVAKPGLVW